MTLTSGYRRCERCPRIRPRCRTGAFGRRADPLQRQDGQTSALEAFTISDPDRVWTVREIANHAAVGGRGPVVVGSPEEVAEELIAWVEETDVDGFNLAYAGDAGDFYRFCYRPANGERVAVLLCEGETAASQ